MMQERLRPSERPLGRRGEEGYMRMDELGITGASL